MCCRRARRWIAVAPWICVLFTVGVGAGACDRGASKRAAKERVFAPLPPDPVEVRAGQAIDLGRLGDDAVVRNRVVRMEFGEIYHRLGGVTFEGEAKIKFRRGETVVSSLEQASIEQSSNGDFKLRVEIKGGDVQNIVYKDGLVFIRHNQGKWRASRDPADERRRWREQAYRLWPSIYDLFESHLRITEAGAVTFGDRSAVRYELFVIEQHEARSPMPPELTSGRDDESERERFRRLARRAEEWRGYAEPKSGAGELIVDEGTGVVLKASFAGKLVIHDRVTDPAWLDVSVTAQLKEIGTDPAIERPKDSVEEFVRRKIVTNPLYFMEGGEPNAPARKPAAASQPAPQPTSQPAAGE